ncbi:MAG TPA: TonB-dependent receptor [Candidatus Saccharimonadales bacterium]|nr:TonB-dependent receptor [Candidatus Saccharimonadales bacterium]
MVLTPNKFSLFRGVATVLFSLIIVLGITPRASRAETPPQGEVLGKEGTVDIARDKAEWSPAQVGQPLILQDRLRTARNSRAMLQLAELGRLRINELTTLEVLPPSEKASDATLDLKAGAIYFFTRGRPRQFQIQTPFAMAASRGTEFLASIAANGQSTFVVFDGAIDLANAFGKVALASGEIGTVNPGQAPVKTAVIQAANIIQWWLYYPGVLDVDELALTQAEKARFAASLRAYRAGDLLDALRAHAPGREPQSDAERIYFASLLLAVGQVQQCEKELARVSVPSSLAEALREVIAATRLRPSADTNRVPKLASEWLARSYSQQSRYDLAGALQSAQAAARKDPLFGFAWERVAELEFSFGRIDEAHKALEKALLLAPRNAQAWALKGFLAAARNHLPAAADAFDTAINLDSALGNAWLGRGLISIRQGHSLAGRRDLQTAAALEPNRSELRSYLAKAFDQLGDSAHTAKELALAKQLDPADPTPWLYAALYLRQQLRFNEAIESLEESLALNDNRRVYRSQLLLDQDRAVRGASLATIYQSDGMNDVSLREAARAVASDYGNSSAHQFLAESFDALRDPTRFNLRYETAWFNELLLANLLAPAGTGNLSANISQEEYSPLFEGNNLGFSASSDYRSDGQLHELASQFGRDGNTSYALDLDYEHNTGVRPNNGLDRVEWYTTIKQQLTPQDSILLLTKYYDYHSGDNFQRYDQSMVRTNYQLNESQTPLLALAYHREWQPGIHTLILAARLQDDLTYRDTGVAQGILFTNASGRVVNMATLGINPATGAPDGGLDVNYRSKLEIYSTELNQIFQTERNTLVFGARIQEGDFVTQDTLTNVQPTADAYLFNMPAASDSVRSGFQRESGYVYDTIEPADLLLLTGGLSYDQMIFPANYRIAPISSAESERHRLSPKAAVVWTVSPEVTLRAAFSRSLGGVSFDESFRLEPTQLAGFNQAFRSIISESIVGSVAAPDYQLAGAAMDVALTTHTYFGLEGDLLTSDVNREYGMFAFNGAFAPGSVGPVNTPQQLNYRESSVTATLNQLLSDDVSLGAQYKFTSSNLRTIFPDIPTAANPALDSDNTANLQQITLFAALNHSSGFFVRLESQWYHQDNFNYTPAEPPEDIWQHNILVGCRLRRQHGEIAVGVLNLTGGDYNLNPLNLYVELPRERVFTARLKFNF